MMSFAIIGSIVFMAAIIFLFVAVYELVKGHNALAERLTKTETSLKRFEDDLK